jgi:uncharacterized protein
MAMDMFMKLPLKVSIVTSDFLIGVTAAASAEIYFMRGDIGPKIAAPVALGVLAGATVGTKIMVKLKSTSCQFCFQIGFYLWLPVPYRSVAENIAQI